MYNVKHEYTNPYSYHYELYDMRPLHAAISLKALRNNLEIMSSKINHKPMVAVVKADAYGHRIASLLPELERNKKVSHLAVAMIEEALVIRELQGKKPVILLEGVFEKEEYFLAAEHNFSVVIANITQLRWLEECSFTRPLEVFLKVDSGMHRLGFPPEEVMGVLERLQNNPKVKEVVLMTHFASADEENSSGMLAQIAVMERFKTLSLRKSYANSAATLFWPETHQDLARVGIALYGTSPVANRKNRYTTDGEDKILNRGDLLDLQPVMRLTTGIIQTFLVRKGDKVGYGGYYQANKNTPIGVIALGYADGYPRELDNEAYVLIDRFPAKVIGRPSMDMATVDLSQVPEEYWHYPVEIFGPKLPVEWLAKWGGTIPYTILTHIAPRVRFSVIDQ